MLAHTASMPAASAFKARPAARRTCRHNTYAVRVRRPLVEDCNLLSGDVIIIRRLQHDTHETVTAQINGRDVALARLSINRHGLHLVFDHPARPAVFLHNRDIEVLSLVMGIEHHSTEH